MLRITITLLSRLKEKRHLGRVVDPPRPLTDPRFLRRFCLDGNDAVWLLELRQSDGGKAKGHACVDSTKLGNQGSHDLPDGATPGHWAILRIAIRGQIRLFVIEQGGRLNFRKQRRVHQRRLFRILHAAIFSVKQIIMLINDGRRVASLCVH